MSMKTLRSVATVINPGTLRKNKGELMKAWDLSPVQWKLFYTLAVNKTWQDFHTSGHHESFAYRDYLEAISKVIGGFGAESLHPEHPDIWYVNMGDSYNTTVLLHQGYLYISTWGDVMEKLEVGSNHTIFIGGHPDPVNVLVSVNAQGNLVIKGLPFPVTYEMFDDTLVLVKFEEETK
jgi:hypothetical protein